MAARIYVLIYQKKNRIAQIKSRKDKKSERKWLGGKNEWKLEQDANSLLERVLN